MKIGLIGCGAIGTEIALAVDRSEVAAQLSGIYDTDSAAAAGLAGRLNSKPAVIPAEELAASSDLVVEAAGVGAVDPLVRLCAKLGKDLLVMSVGGLKPEHFDLFNNGGGATLHLPSGAVAGIDGILAYASAGFDSITLTSRKPPAGFAGAPFLKQNNISLDGITEPLTLFEGSASDAISAFPKNINVSTTIALACGAPEKLTVRIVADPGITVNTHEIRLVSPLGNITALVENLPSPENPRTSALAYLSAIAALRKITSKVRIGT